MDVQTMPDQMVPATHAQGAQNNIEPRRSPAEDYWAHAVRPRISMLETGLYRQGAEVANTLEEAIDAELAAIYTATFAIKSLRNTRAATHHLPPEVLTRIFWSCSVQEPPSRRTNLIRYESWEILQQWDPGWIKVTYVCRYWRDAALQDPRLWGSNITCDLPFSWFEETLTRSKLAPASIRLTSGYGKSLERSHEAIVLLSKHLHHIRHLHLRGGLTSDVLPVIGALGLSCAPILETLTLEPDSRNDLAMLPDETIAHHAPRLLQI